VNVCLFTTQRYRVVFNRPTLNFKKEKLS